jgi:hypothetical protein
VYLQVARKLQPSAEFDAAVMGNPDIPVTEEFLESHPELMLAANGALGMAAAQNGAVDSDVREALASLIQTYRTLQSGVIYEGLLANPIAAHLYRAVQESLGAFRQEEMRQTGISKTRDSDVLKLLVFFERLALDRHNGRPRSRAFLDLLRVLQPEAATDLDMAPSSLILPG